VGTINLIVGDGVFEDFLVKVGPIVGDGVFEDFLVKVGPIVGDGVFEDFLVKVGPGVSIPDFEDFEGGTRDFFDDFDFFFIPLHRCLSRLFLAWQNPFNAFLRLRLCASFFCLPPVT
jgi:hypothetical protein